MRKNMAKKVAAGAVLGGSLLFTGGLGVASAAPPLPPLQDGLVNVAVGNVTVAKDVNVDAAAQVAANACGVTVQNVNALASGVVQNGQPATVCTTPTGPVSITKA